MRVENHLQQLHGESTKEIRALGRLRLSEPLFSPRHIAGGSWLQMGLVKLLDQFF
jgi:hypothetical protein